MRNITLMIKATLLTAQKSGYFTYTSLLVTGMQGDGVSSFPSGGSSSKMAPKKKKVAYIVLLFPIHCCASHLIFFHN
ncbi:BDM_1a_G0018090.mRNA.1.CDS.1 [Saccharomyces cerevisiae]|nr:BDM_1a_G0018090.mRNA.1.CDS.1 [Saccharomyces cerevisiae]CAI6507287.1 BBF_HP1_G0018100.mRNA.1.CDS.1 [Saccharomyces cerevisiae]CAI7113609.1 BDM_1a_G0018090.mRNA.1.CDS.1 [Saccharomyces cerevisiae]